MEIPRATLFVDGVSHEPFSVTEDYPLHPSGIETQLAVGACWQGIGRGPLLSPRVSGAQRPLCGGGDRLSSVRSPSFLCLPIPFPERSLSGDPGVAVDGHPLQLH